MNGAPERSWRHRRMTAIEWLEWDNGRDEVVF